MATTEQVGWEESRLIGDITQVRVPHLWARGAEDLGVKVQLFA